MPTRRKATWPHTRIHSKQELALKGQRLTRLNREIADALTELRRGASLHLSHSPRPHWRTSTGVFVGDDVARIVINTPGVISVGDALFTGTLGQTWRYMENENA